MNAMSLKKRTKRSNAARVLYVFGIFCVALFPTVRASAFSDIILPPRKPLQKDIYYKPSLLDYLKPAAVPLPPRKPVLEAMTIPRILEPTMRKERMYKSALNRTAEENQKVKAFKNSVMTLVKKGELLNAVKVMQKDPNGLFMDKAEYDRLIAEVAAAYYYEGHIEQAYELSRNAAKRTGVKAPMSGWIAGLCAWRQGEYKNAAAYFEIPASSTYASGWLSSAGSYWAGRAFQQMEDTTRMKEWYQKAAAYERTLYGLAAAAALGKLPSFDWSQSRDGSLYPVAHWLDQDQYYVDPALINAIIRQESKFNPKAQSSGGAQGLMQIMPGTASVVTNDDSYTTKDGVIRLLNPQTNIQIGQKYIKTLLKNESVRGDVVRLLVAYNAGPGNLAKWNVRLKTVVDPLLYIESIPAGQTRDFVERVIANYWIYKLRAGQAPPSLASLVAGENIYRVAISQ